MASSPSDISDSLSEKLAIDVVDAVCDQENDLSLLIGSLCPKSFKVTSSLLRKTSAFFEGLLDVGVSPDQGKELQLNAIDPLGFELLLPYLYTGHVGQLQFTNGDHICKILKVATYLGIEESGLKHLTNCVCVKEWRSVTASVFFQPSYVTTEQLSDILDELKSKVEIVGIAKEQPLKIIIAWAINGGWSLSQSAALNDLGRRFGNVLELEHCELRRIIRNTSTTCAIINAVVPVNDLFKRLDILEEKFDTSTAVRLCTQCNMSVHMCARNDNTCCFATHPGFYKCGPDHGWSCCSKPFKKDDGCEEKRSTHRL
jgi:hypothetical protein